MTSFKDYGARAEKWALQTSTIGGVAAIASAVAGGGAEAMTAMPVLSIVIGLVAGGAFAIALPGRDSAPVIAGGEEILTAIESHKTDLDKASTSAQAAASVVSAVVPKLAAAAETVTAQVAELTPVVQAVAVAAGKPGVVAIVADAEHVLGAAEAGLATTR